MARASARHILVPTATQAGTASALVAVPTSTSVASDAATSVVASGTSVASDVSAEPTPAAPVTDTPYVEPTPTPPSTPAVAPAPTAATAAVASIDAYRGLGSWVDIYDAKAWKDPAAAVADMAGHGVRTLFLETSNSRSSFTIKNTAGASTFIREAHARGMKVVAWYLPDMKNGSTDYDRIAAAIGFRTSDGQKFDSFALDIESSAIKSESARNSALASLSARIRSLVGATYPLGAIIPSPAGLAKKLGYWDNFPYAAIARAYDVFVPMSYYTYHTKTASGAYDDTDANVRIIRAQKGCSKIPIHLIGGIDVDSSTAETQAFVRAAVAMRCVGASFYQWSGTSAADWAALSAIKP